MTTTRIIAALFLLASVCVAMRPRADEAGSRITNCSPPNPPAPTAEAPAVETTAPQKPDDEKLADPEYKFPGPLDAPEKPPRCCCGCNCDRCTGKPGCPCGCPSCTCNKLEFEFDALPRPPKPLSEGDTCRTCPNCNGTGTVASNRACKECGGDGVICTDDHKPKAAPVKSSSFGPSVSKIEAVQRAKTSGHAWFISFTMGDRCPGCVEVEGKVYSDSAVQGSLAKFKTAEVRPGRDARSFGVSRYPKCVVVRSDGSVSEPFTPPNDPRAFLERLNRAVNPKIFAGKKPQQQYSTPRRWGRR